MCLKAVLKTTISVHLGHSRLGSQNPYLCLDCGSTEPNHCTEGRAIQETNYGHFKAVPRWRQMDERLRDSYVVVNDQIVRVD